MHCDWKIGESLIQKPPFFLVWHLCNSTVCQSVCVPVYVMCHGMFKGLEDSLWSWFPPSTVGSRDWTQIIKLEHLTNCSLPALIARGLILVHLLGT